MNSSLKHMSFLCPIKISNRIRPVAKNIIHIQSRRTKFYQSVIPIDDAFANCRRVFLLICCMLHLVTSLHLSELGPLWKISSM